MRPIIAFKTKVTLSAMEHGAQYFLQTHLITSDTTGRKLLIDIKISSNNLVE